MTQVWIDPVGPAPGFMAEVVTFSPGSPPPRPLPVPPGSIWDPLFPTNPIAGIPGLPGYEPPLGIWGPPGPWPTPPIYFPPTGGAPTPAPGKAVVIPVPVTDPPTAPPEGMPAGSSQYLVWFGPGTKPAAAWIGPYASTGPITPPAA